VTTPNPRADTERPTPGRTPRKPRWAPSPRWSAPCSHGSPTPRARRRATSRSRRHATRGRPARPSPTPPAPRAAVPARAAPAWGCASIARAGRPSTARRGAGRPAQTGPPPRRRAAASSAGPGSRGGGPRDRVLDPLAAGLGARRGRPARGAHRHPPRAAARRRLHRAGKPHRVPDRHPPPKAPRRDRHGHRPRRRDQGGPSERAEEGAAILGGPRWCPDEAGLYPTLPQPGASWEPDGEPARPPHASRRGGRAPRLPRFRPASGPGRAQPVARAPNAGLPPGRRAALRRSRAALPPRPAVGAAGGGGPGWEGGEGSSRAALLARRAAPPPIRRVRVWGPRAGHPREAIGRGCVEPGILRRDTPLGGAGRNRAEAGERLVGWRAGTGPHPPSGAKAFR
jgi:hypothetical protein